MQYTEMILRSFISKISLWLSCAMLVVFSFQLTANDGKPVLLYSRYFNAEGEKRYLPDGSYREILKELKTSFEVRVHAERLTKKTLSDVDVILISNPSAEPVEGNPPPAKMTSRDRRQLLRFIRRGGGLIIMGNQENHNLETVQVNKFLNEFGMQWVDNYTDAKGLQIPQDIPVLGGLKWGYYTGNQIRLTQKTGMSYWTVPNDLSQAPVNGERDAQGILLAGAGYQKGRFVLVTDSGWINNTVLEGKGLGGAVIENDDNLEIMMRLCLWASGR